MKKILSMITVSGLALVTIASVGVSVFAEGPTEIQGDSDATNNLADLNHFKDGTEKGATAKSTAQFIIEGGLLTLDAVPDMNFGETSVTELLNGDVSLTYKDSIVSDTDVKSKNKDAFDGNNTGLIQVTDARGVDAGWALSFKATPFETSDGHKVADEHTGSQLNGVTLAVLNAKVTSDETTTPETLTQEFKFDDASQVFTVAKAEKGMGAGVNSYKVLETTKLNIPKQNKAYTGTYQSTLTWTLSNTENPGTF